MNSNGIAITVEYLPSDQNKLAEQESSRKVDSSEWMLNKSVLQNVCFKLGNPEIDLFNP